MDELINKFLHKESKIAVIGASNNPEKYGYKVVEFLQKREYKVFPVNPKYEKIFGLQVTPNIEELPDYTDIFNFVLPSSVGLQIVKQSVNLKYKPLIWLQPGAESEEIIRFCKENDLPCVYARCIMQEIFRQQMSEKK